MNDNEMTVISEADTQEIYQPPTIATVEKSPATFPAIPKPVFLRLLMLSGGGIGCLLVGIIVAIVTGDMILLALSAIIGTAFMAIGFQLKRKIDAGSLYSVSGVCVSIAPKMLGRYNRIELLNTDTGGDMNFILPKKIAFKVGHVYTCYFDNPICNLPEEIEPGFERMVTLEDAPSAFAARRARFFNADMGLPTNGFLGFECFGIYQEKSATAEKSGGKNDTN